MAADSAALEAQVPEEPAVAVRARLVLKRQLVLAALLLRLAVLVPPGFLVQRRVPADRLLKERPVLAHSAAVPVVDLPLSPRSFSAAMARSTR